MTGQIADSFLVDGDEYRLVGISGEGLFDPQEYKLQPYSRCTACWRGFSLEYDIRDGTLVLTKLYINLKEPKTIQGIQPVSAQDDFGFFDYVYHLDIEIPFTGTILLGKDMIPEMYVHMGFQRAIAFRTVYEFEFNDGKVTKKRDLSEKMKQRRETDPTEGAAPKKPQSTKEWIADTFSLEYDPKE
ncbi:MAG: hypothetical protein GF411_14990 [Candidatus Lokiarchaeota archaeon]|nr:hypothetical protein [Candidatus Lokiarchaeota archaeon]